MSRVAIIGAGTVGSVVVRMLRASQGVEVAGVLVRDAAKPRGFEDWRRVVTVDPEVLDRVDLVIEVAGGTGPAADHMLAALARGVPVVTANKAALAERWDEFATHLNAGQVWCEAAVMAGTPIVGPLTKALAGCRPVSLHAILNGTCNVVLSDMEAGMAFEEALSRAQAAGFAEADPTLDVEGIDAAHKATVLARLAFDPALPFQQVRDATVGISGLDSTVVADQVRRGRSVRLVASVHAGPDGWRAAVRPLSLPAEHPLVTRGAVNAAVFVGDPVGEVYVRGAGAGGGSTATAVVSDALAALAGGRGHTPRAAAAALPPDAERLALPQGAEEL
ncbi:MAG TPA: homoserine dehydrogenase [Trueperaceae bacterium]